MKSFFRKLLPFLSIFLIISCSNGTSKGSLSITLGSSARSAERVTEDWKELGLTAESFDYEVLVIYPDETEIKQTLKWGDTYELSDLDEGSYTVKVEAKKNIKDIYGDKTKELPIWLKFFLEKFYPDLKEDEIITFYKGSQTKTIVGGEVTTFDIKLKNALTEPDDDPADEPSDCPFYTDPIEETQFHTIKTLGSMMQPIDAFAVLEEGQYYQIVPETTTTEENQYVEVTINLITPKEGQEPEVTTLKEDCIFYGANYFCILLMDGEKPIPYILLTEYSEENCKNDSAFLTNLIQICMNEYNNMVEKQFPISNFFDLTFASYNAIQISQYMPNAYESLWKNYETYKLFKNDSALAIERPYFLNELEESDLKNLGIAKIILNLSILGNAEPTFITYAMDGNSVSLPTFDDSLTLYFDKDCKEQVDGSSLTVNAGYNNLYIDGMEDDPEGGNPDGGNGGSTDPNADISGSYFDNESKTITFEKISCYDGGERFRANVDISDLFDKYTIKTGDTVVFTISGKTDLGISNIYWQFAEENNGNYNVYEDKYNSCSLINDGIRSYESFSLPMPQNRITIPEGANYNTFQLFYDGDYGITIQDFKLSYRIYSADKNVYECKKSYSDGKWYNEFTVALKDYAAFEGKTFNGQYYFTATVTNGTSISVKELNLWNGNFDECNWIAGNNKNLPSQSLESLYVESEKTGVSLSNCILQFKSEAINPEASVTLVGFDIKTLN